MTDLVRWNPFEHLAKIYQEMDKMMQESLQLFPRENFFTLGLHDDEFNLQDKPGEIVVTMEVPGATKDNVNVMVNEDRLTVGGEAKVTGHDKGASTLHWSKFSRTYALPAKVDAKASTVNFKGSTLEIKMPKLKKK
ncbi:MAG: Hsp20/alpha crystallin family protein [Bacillota bacterium]